MSLKNEKGIDVMPRNIRDAAGHCIKQGLKVLHHL